MKCENASEHCQCWIYGDDFCCNCGEYPPAENKDN